VLAIVALFAHVRGAEAWGPESRIVSYSTQRQGRRRMAAAQEYGSSRSREFGCVGDGNPWSTGPLVADHLSANMSRLSALAITAGKGGLLRVAAYADCGQNLARKAGEISADGWPELKTRWACRDSLPPACRYVHDLVGRRVFLYRQGRSVGWQ